MITLTPLLKEMIEAGTVVCPKCHSSIGISTNALICSGGDCGSPVDVIQEQVPILVDFSKDTVLSKDALLNTKGESLIPRTDSRNSLPKKILWGDGAKTKENLEKFVSIITAESGKEPVVLVVGGGAVGRGTEGLFSKSNIKVLSFDIYASANTDFIADGHDIPIADGTIDGVWIQAVLEHVLYPQVVVSEIHRVLKKGGIIYAETPFLQNVHEGPYDFTRFTESGHRLLFSKFSLIDSGYLNGLGTVLLWNIRYLLWGLTRSRKIATVLTFPFFWIRYLEKLIPREVNVDSASGVFFLGRKTGDAPITSKDIVSHYKGYQRSH